MKDYSNFRTPPSDTLLWSGQKLFKRQLEYFGEDVQVDGVSTKAIIMSHSNPFNEQKEDRKFLCDNDINIKRGSIVDYDGFKWLVISEVDSNKINKSAKILQVNNILKFYDQNHILIQIPCIISRTISLSNSEDKFLTTVDNEFYLTVSNNPNTQQIKINTVYKVGLSNYQIVSIPDDITQPGLLIFKVKYSEQTQETHNYTIEVLNGESVKIQEGYTLQLNVNVYDNGILLSPTPPLTYISSNELICLVDTNGLITAQSNIDSCEIGVSLSSDGSVSCEIVVNVISVPVDNLTVTINGNTSITKGYTSDYKADFNVNGVNFAEVSEFYLTSDDGVSPTPLAQILTQDTNTNTCTVKGISAGYVRLFIKNLSGTMVSDGYRILIKNLF